MHHTNCVHLLNKKYILVLFSHFGFLEHLVWGGGVVLQERTCSHGLVTNKYTHKHMDVINLQAN